MVTVVMPVYNTKQVWLQQAIDSILNQTYRDFKFLIIDDGSKDETREYLLKRAREDSRIILVFNEKNMGLIATLNKAISLVDTEWIARMDDDDVSLPDRLQLQVEAIEKHPHLDYFGMLKNLINSEGKPIRLERSTEDVLPESIGTSLIWGCAYAHPTMMYRKKVIEQAGGYPQCLYAEDYALWARLFFELNNRNTMIIGKPGINYRKIKGKYSEVQQISDYEVKGRILAEIGMGDINPKALSMGNISSDSITFKQLLEMIGQLDKLKKRLMSDEDFSHSDVSRKILHSKIKLYKVWLKSLLK